MRKRLRLNFKVKPSLPYATLEKEAQVKPSLPHLRKRLRLNFKVKPSLPYATLGKRLRLNRHCHT